MKCSCRGDRTDRAGKHLDRNFDLSRADHIAPALVKNNRYWTWNGKENQTFEEAEIEFYEEHFRKYLDQQNQKHSACGNYRRIRSMDDYHKGLYTRPEGKILEIGNVKEHATPEQLWECAMQFKDDIEAMYEGKIRILDMALHLDEPESAPHVHYRQVWIANTKDGIERVNQTDCLEQLGIKAPKPNEEITRMNNPKMSYSSMEKSRFENICMERVQGIERRSIGSKQKKTTLELKVEGLEMQIEQMEAERRQLASNLTQFQMQIREAELKKKQLDKEIQELEKTSEFRNALEYKLLQENYRNALAFIHEKHLDKEFEKVTNRSAKVFEKEIQEANFNSERE